MPLSCRTYHAITVVIQGVAPITKQCRADRAARISFCDVGSHRFFPGRGLDLKRVVLIRFTPWAGIVQIPDHTLAESFAVFLEFYGEMSRKVKETGGDLEKDCFSCTYPTIEEDVKRLGAPDVGKVLMFT